MICIWGLLLADCGHCTVRGRNPLIGKTGHSLHPLGPLFPSPPLKSMTNLLYDDISQPSIPLPCRRGLCSGLPALLSVFFIFIFLYSPIRSVRCPGVVLVRRGWYLLRTTSCPCHVPESGQSMSASKTSRAPKIQENQMRLHQGWAPGETVAYLRVVIS